MMSTIFILGGVVILIFVGVLALAFMKSNQVDLTSKTNEKPDWMRSDPPAETIAAAEGVTMYHDEKGEHVAAPFAEQIEDILHAILEADPALKAYKVDLGTGPNDELEIWVNEKKYISADELPNEGLKKAFHEAVKRWESKK